MSRVTAIISALVICIIVCLSWAVNHYRDNAITYKAQRDKNARELKLANAEITEMQMRQRDVAALDAKYTKELADAKAAQTRSRKKIIFKIVKCIQQIKMFLFKRCHGIHKNSSLSIVINHAICYLTSSRLLVGVSGCCFGRVTYRMPFLYSASSFSASMPVKSKLLW